MARFRRSALAAGALVLLLALLGALGAGALSRRAPDYGALQPGAGKIVGWLHDPAAPVVLVAAHRGGVRPENSLAALRHAIRLGADVAEVDVRVSRDGVPFLLHDETLDRTTTGSGRFHPLAWEEIARLRLRHSRDGETVPSLESALRLARGRIVLDLDVKDRDRVEPVLARVRDLDMLHQVVFFLGGSTERAERLARREPEALVMPRARSAEEVDALLERFERLALIHVSPDFLSPDLARRAAGRGARLWVNALSWPDALAHVAPSWAYGRLVDNGAGAIQTDVPQILLAHLRDRERHP